VKAPRGPVAGTPEDILAAGAAWWPLEMARELDDAILSLRTNELAIGTWVLKTEGDPQAVLAADAILLAHREHWFVRETIGLLRRAFARLDVSARTLFAVIEPGSCFCGTLLELALAADRIYMLHLADDAARAPRIALDGANFNLYPMVSDQSRIGRRFYEEPEAMTAARRRCGELLDAPTALELGLVTSAPDDIDWSDEIRLAIEERISLSPDALTGMEANLRFNGKETMLTRIFGRLSAWQNWIFIRPNATGDKGALKLYGKGEKPQFDWDRV
jgi:benzoyl-CoA-dihydrodiol lyase